MTMMLLVLRSAVTVALGVRTPAGGAAGGGGEKSPGKAREGVVLRVEPTDSPGERLSEPRGPTPVPGEADMPPVRVASRRRGRERTGDAPMPPVLRAPPPSAPPERGVVPSSPLLW